MPNAKSRTGGLKEVAVGSLFNGNVIVRSTEIRYRDTGDAYLVLEVGDHSGRLKGRIWEQALHYDRQLSPGQVINLQARIEIFRNARTFRLQNLIILRHATAEDCRELLPKGNSDPAELEKVLRTHLHTISKPHFRQLVEIIYWGENGLWPAVLHAPAGKLWHYNYVHGLAEQMCHLLDLGETLALQFPEIESDLLKTGIFCRLAGFADAFTLNGYVDYGTEARLFGTATIGYQKVSEATKKIGAFPEEQRQCVLHLVAFSSQDEQLIHSDFVPPQTLEAIALESLLRVVRTINAVARIIKKDVPPSSKWSKHIQLLNRSIYVGHKNQSD